MVDAAELVRLGAATVGEAGGRPMAPRLQAFWPGATAAGPAFTARIPAGDNLAVHVAVATAPPGSVLVVEVGPGDPFGYWGEVLSTGAQARGLAGLVIDGCTRDRAAVAELGFPVFCTGAALQGAQKVGPGRVGAPVRVGDVEVATGDAVVADADGVTAVAAAELDAVVAAARARADKERDLFAALRRGATTVELLDLDTGAIERG